MKTTTKKQNAVNYGTDWSNIDLSRPCESNLNILEPYSFDCLLLEIHCNLTQINEATIREQFNASLQSKINSANEVFEANLKNILKHSTKERNNK